MDSSFQSSGMAGNHLTPDPFHTGSGVPPLPDSMHAMVPYPYIPVPSQLQNAEHSDRIVRLEQQQFQDGVNSHYRSVQTSQSLQHLQQQFYQMQQAIVFDIPALRRQVEALQVRLDRKDNADCTRLIQLEPRTQEQKLHSALKNANLVRIYASTSMHENATSKSSALRRAEQMEALATLLRGRVHRGGAAYLSEAEDAEAWAAKLREDVEHLRGPEVDNKLLMESGPGEPFHTDTSNDNVQAEMTQEEPERQRTSTPISTPLTKLSPSSCRRRAVRTPMQDSNLTQNKSSTPKDMATPAQSAWGNSSIHPHTPSAQRSKSSKCSGSGVLIKIKEPSGANVTSVRLEAVSTQRARKLAPHLKYASQQIQVSKDCTPAIEATTNDGTTKTQRVSDTAKVQVPSVIPPHRRMYKRALTPPTPKPDSKSTKWEMEESKPAQIQAQQSVSDKFKEESSPVQEKCTSVKNVPRKKNKKSRPNRSTRVARAKAAERSQVESACTNKKDAWPSESVEFNVFPAKASKQPEMHNTTEVEREKRNEFASSLDLTTPTWQPTYLKDLPLLSSSELEDIPSSPEMHAFDRTFITTHLGGMKWLPSFYSVPESERSLLPDRGYYLLEDVTEPLAPITPGAHGSLVTPILRLPESDNPATPKPESMLNAPLFIKRGDEYVYYGMYSHLRSDRLDLERCNALIPAYLKEHWASQLTSPRRPKWVTEALQNHLRPPPSYPRPSSSASSDAITAALSTHHRALESWHRDTSLLTSFLRPSNILDAFAAPDTGASTPGLRFWCLGLKCEGWDKGFYEMMRREERLWEKQGRRDGEKEREEQKEMLRLLGKGKPVKW